jgi:hypothetical protein
MGSKIPGISVELRDLTNVGKATQRDFDVLGISSVAQLAQCDADELYVRLNSLTGQRHDPCVWDVFAATIHQARTGAALPWWRWTEERKNRQAAGKFCV